MVFKRAAILLSLVAGARQPINGRERRAAPRSCVQRSSRKNSWTGGAAMFFMPFSSGLAPPFGGTGLPQLKSNTKILVTPLVLLHYC